MAKCKTELDIKLNEHLINAARELHSHCVGTMNCGDCIFCIMNGKGYQRCRLHNDPCIWEVDHEQL